MAKRPIKLPIKIIRPRHLLKDEKNITPEEAARRTARKKQSEDETVASTPQAAGNKPASNQPDTKEEGKQDVVADTEDTR